MKSETQSEASSEAHGERTTDSVFDFLYHDGRRVASFLAQFDSSGSLTQISQGTVAEKSRGDTQKLDGNVSFKFFKAGMASTDDVRSRRQDEIMRVYDPMWANARALLDLLDERGMIQGDLEAAQIGQIVLVSGYLDLYDLKIMSGFWNLAAVKKLIGIGVARSQKLSKAQQSTAAGKKMMTDLLAAEKAGRDGMEVFMEMAPSLPHSTHVIIRSSEGDQLWCNVDPAGLSMPPSDILLKHGITVPGIWTILGILDALPEPMEARNRPQTPGGEEMAAKLFETLAPVIRTMFGRPETAFGMTPLLIFRETIAPSV